MLKIKRVDMLDGQTLDIELSNGHLILFDMHALPEDDPVAVWMHTKPDRLRPATDGTQIFWPDGPSLSLERILASVGDA